MKFNKRIAKRIAIAILAITIMLFSIPKKTNYIEPDSRTDSPKIIPKIIHQTWKTNEIPLQWIQPHSSCKEKYLDFEFILWNDTMSINFIQQKYPWFYDTFTSYRYPIQRADAIRYFVLYEYGGIYLDLDIGCSDVSLEPLLEYQMIIPKTKPIGYSNDLILSIPKHPFMGILIHALPKWNKWFVIPYLTVFCSTGPMFLNIQYWLYGTNVSILSPNLYSEGTRKMFTHHQGSSWHDWDAAIFKFLFAWKVWIFIALVLVRVRDIRKRAKRLVLPL